MTSANKKNNWDARKNPALVNTRSVDRDNMAIS